jgi:hypothetical protein
MVASRFIWLSSGGQLAWRRLGVEDKDSYDACHRTAVTFITGAKNLGGEAGLG